MNYSFTTQIIFRESVWRVVTPMTISHCIKLQVVKRIGHPPVRSFIRFDEGLTLEMSTQETLSDQSLLRNLSPFIHSLFSFSFFHSFIRSLVHTFRLLSFSSGLSMMSSFFTVHLYMSVFWISGIHNRLQQAFWNKMLYSSWKGVSFYKAQFSPFSRRSMRGSTAFICFHVITPSVVGLSEIWRKGLGLNG